MNDGVETSLWKRSLMEWTKILRVILLPSLSAPSPFLRAHAEILYPKKPEETRIDGEGRLSQFQLVECVRRGEDAGGFGIHTERSRR